MLILFFISSALIVFLLCKGYSRDRYQLLSKQEGLQEKFNILNDQNVKELTHNSALEAKLMRYRRLEKLIEDINATLDLDKVADELVSTAFSLVSSHKGVCALYLVDHQAQKLSLLKTKKEDAELVVRAKEGDIFDWWVLHHGSPLLIEDTKSDFRFDLEKVKAQGKRPFLSLVSSSLVSGSRALGILRLDNPKPHFYSQDDLRFLVKMCELGAVALENSELFQKTQDLAIHDGLTGAYTKGYFLERLEEECRRCRRHNALFSLFMIDIDFFKKYNDTFGHIAGDIVLRNLSQTLKGALKELAPLVGRFGGEEFCVVLPGIDKKKAAGYAGLLRERIAQQAILLRRQETHITVSIGVASFPVDAAQEEELIQKADKAMYQAKQKGRNQVCGI